MNLNLQHNHQPTQVTMLDYSAETDIVTKGLVLLDFV
jgi:hypothetical protein